MRSRGKFRTSHYFLAGFLALAAGLLIVSPARAQTHTTTDFTAGAGFGELNVDWDTSISSDKRVRAVAISPVDVGGVRLGFGTGSDFDGTLLHNDVFTVAVDMSDGSVVWSASFDSPDLFLDDQGRKLLVSADGLTLYVIAAIGHFVSTLDAPSFGVLAYRTVTEGADPAGSLRWTATFAATGGSNVNLPLHSSASRDMPWDACLTTVGGVPRIYVVGQVLTNPAAGASAALGRIVALNGTTGATIWSDSFATTPGHASNLYAPGGTGYQPGYFGCDCNDEFVGVAATDVQPSFAGGATADRYAVVIGYDSAGTRGIKDSFGSTATSAAFEMEMYKYDHDADTGTPDRTRVAWTFRFENSANGGITSMDFNPFPNEFSGTTFWINNFADGGAGHNAVVKHFADASLSGGGSAVLFGSTTDGALTGSAAAVTHPLDDTNRFTRFTTRNRLTGGSQGVFNFFRDDDDTFTAGLIGPGDSSRPDLHLSALIAPAPAPFDGTRYYQLMSHTALGGDADSLLVVAQGSLATTALPGNGVGDYLGMALVDGALGGGDDNAVPALSSETHGAGVATQNPSGVFGFTWTAMEADRSSQQLMDLATYGDGSQQILVGITEEIASTRFTLVAYSPDVPVPPSIDIVVPADGVPDPFDPLRDGVVGSALGIPIEVLVTLGDLALDVDPVQTSEDAVYVGINGALDLLLSFVTGTTYDGLFRTSRPNEVPFDCTNEGANDLTAEAFDIVGLSGTDADAKIINNARAADALCTHFAFLFINAMIRSTFSTGFGPAPHAHQVIYLPDNLVTRAEMAVFTARVVSYNLSGDQTDFDGFTPPLVGGVCDDPGNEGESFTDVPCTNFAYKHIEYLLSKTRSDGPAIIGGVAPGQYAPTARLKRNQMAVFMTGARDQADGDFVTFVPPTAGSETFTDVPSTDPFYSFIEYIVSKVITLGFGDGTYRPGNFVTRGEMSVMIIRSSVPTVPF